MISSAFICCHVSTVLLLAICNPFRDKESSTLQHAQAYPTEYALIVTLQGRNERVQVEAEQAELVGTTDIESMSKLRVNTQ